MTKTCEIRAESFLFDAASDALQAALNFEVNTLEFYDYEVREVADPNRFDGYEVLVRTPRADGSALLGFLAEVSR